MDRRRHRGQQCSAQPLTTLRSARLPAGRPQGGPTGSVHRFRGSAPQIKSGAGSAREVLSPVRSPQAGSHKSTGSHRRATQLLQASVTDCLWEPTLWATCGATPRRADQALRYHSLRSATHKTRLAAGLECWLVDQGYGGLSCPPPCRAIAALRRCSPPASCLRRRTGVISIPAMSTTTLRLKRGRTYPPPSQTHKTRLAAGFGCWLGD